MSLLVYVVMAVSAAIGLIWRIKLAHAVAASCAPIGASFTFVALATGSIWGKPMWGTWWEWDPRLTSELILLFLYLGYIALRASFDDTQRADRASAVLAIVGVDQCADHSLLGRLVEQPAPGADDHEDRQAPTISTSMLVPLLTMMLGFTLYFGAILLVRVRGEVLKRERNALWIREALS